MTSRPDTNTRNQFSYAAYWDGVCRAIASADPDFSQHSSKCIAKWKKSGADVRLITSEEAIRDIGKHWDSLPKDDKSQGKLL